ncbi:2-hydroxyacylsphingosine 1-beta-galactosyltransferase [Armadillidium vulgare]|nr:2-hydroxyacylsphingosine 1-beta-galactosyltransferase [Armadillidium vulgare]
MGIAEALAKRGHHVTMVSPFEPFKKLDNVREILIENYDVNDHLKGAFEGKHSIMSLFTSTPKMCIDGLGQQKIQDLKKEKFDLIILNVFFDYCYLSFVHHFQIPFIYASSGALHGPLHDLVGNIDFPSLSGNVILEPGFPLTFSQRLVSTLINSVFKLMATYYLEPKMYSDCIKAGLCPKDMPSFSEINKNASLAIINSVRTLELPPRPAMPNVIYAGGAHIKAPKKLPKDLEEWVQGSGEEGFIFFSLGSALNPDYLPEEWRQILVKVFGTLKQRVLWKWNKETMPDLPKNVKLQKWLPQPDLLGHPKIRLFITHGGQMSTIESSHHGVPVIGMSVFADQHFNMKVVQNEGWGRLVDWKTLEETSFRNVIQDVLNNKTMKEIAKRKSAIMQDRLVPPDEEAAYWVEYVMRHKGAPHIMSPVRLMYEIYNIDIWAFIIFVLVLVVSILVFITKFVLKRCFGFGRSKIDKKKREANKLNYNY